MLGVLADLQHPEPHSEPGLGDSSAEHVREAHERVAARMAEHVRGRVAR